MIFTVSSPYQSEMLDWVKGRPEVDLLTQLLKSGIGHRCGLVAPRKIFTSIFIQRLGVTKNEVS
jgi:hypothetical protein